MGNKYWNGTEHAVLKKSDVFAKWIKGPQGDKGLAATNKAFCIWYHGRKTANDAFSRKMASSLEDCGTAGWGSGISDLREAFSYLEDRKGCWFDDTISSSLYNWKVGGGPIAGNSIPLSIKSFLAAVDDMMPKLQKAMKEYQQECAQLQAIKLKPQSPTSDWVKVNKSLGKIKSTAQNVSRYAWLALATVTADLPSTSANWARIADIEEATEYVSLRSGQTVKFLDAVGKMSDSLTMYVKTTQAFEGDRRLGVAFAGLSLALSFVPVLGGFYGGIVNKIPGLVTLWRGFIADYTWRTRNPEIYQKLEMRKPPPWKCNICGSS